MTQHPRESLSEELRDYAGHLLRGGTTTLEQSLLNRAADRIEELERERDEAKGALLRLHDTTTVDRDGNYHCDPGAWRQANDVLGPVHLLPELRQGLNQ